MSSSSDEKTPVKLTYPSVGHGAPTKGKRDYTNNTQWFLQEKIDGSQFTTIVKKEGLEFYCGTKRIGAGAGVFNKAMEMMTTIKDRLAVGYAYHGECVQNLKQNTIVYERTPAFFNIIYDIQDPTGKFLYPAQCDKLCADAGLEYLRPITATTQSADPHATAALIVDNMDKGYWHWSALGKNTIPEGVVLKCHDFTVGDKSSNTKLKFVRKAFKEMNNSKKPKAQSRSPSQYCAWVGSLFYNVARFIKACQHVEAEAACGIMTAKDELEQVDRELDRDLLKERSRLIHKYLVVEFVPIVKANERKRKEFDEKWGDDPIYKSLVRLDPYMKDLEDWIYALCLLKVLEKSR